MNNCAGCLLDRPSHRGDYVIGELWICDRGMCGLVTYLARRLRGERPDPSRERRNVRRAISEWNRAVRRAADVACAQASQGRVRTQASDRIPGGATPPPG